MIGTLVLIIFSLCFILLRSIENLDTIAITGFIIELITLIVISLTATFTLRSAKAAQESAAMSATNIKLLQQAEKRKIKPLFTIENKELNLETGKINEEWDDRGNILKLIILNSSVATDVSVKTSVKNIKDEFVSELSRISVIVDKDKKAVGLLQGRLFIENSTLATWAEVETKTFESVFAKEVNNGYLELEIPEAFICLMNSYFRLYNYRIELPFLEINISYSDFEGNKYEEKWGFHFKSKNGPLGSCISKVKFTPIKY